ncbi:hypothetical protein ACQP0I_04360 [Micromonospora carbonacea]|uniref:hypothetical protein n=1 Tax=Micromonospora carbonacea TaxID=47853 RepID=UPI003D95710B
MDQLQVDTSCFEQGRALRVAVREIPFAPVRQRLEGVDQLSGVGRNGWYAADLGIRSFAAIRDWATATATADHIESLD